MTEADMCRINENMVQSDQADLFLHLHCRQDTQVMLSGQGLDELFTGYSWYSEIAKKDGYVRLHTALWQDVALSYADALERQHKALWRMTIEGRIEHNTVAESIPNSK